MCELCAQRFLVCARRLRDVMWFVFLVKISHEGALATMNWANNSEFEFENEQKKKQPHRQSITNMYNYTNHEFITPLTCLQKSRVYIKHTYAHRSHMKHKHTSAFVFVFVVGWVCWVFCIVSKLPCLPMWRWLCWRLRILCGRTTSLDT